MNNLERLKAKALQNEAVKAEYEKLAEEFELIDQLLTMRTEAGLTQEELAQRLGTNKSNVSRMERGRANPSWKLISRYAEACGYHIKLDLIKITGKEVHA